MNATFSEIKRLIGKKITILHLKRNILVAICLILIGSLKAQTSAGTDFWVASTYPFYSGDSFYLAIASEKPTSARMDIPLANYSDSVTLGYNEIKYIKVPANIRQSYYYWYSTAPKKIGENAIHVTSKLPVRVYAFVDGRWYSCGATAVYPTKTQPPGGKYYPYKSRWYSGGSGGSTYKNFFFSVVGIDDSVTVKFNTSTTMMWNMPPGNQITLRKGEMVRIYTWILGADPNLEVEAQQGKRIAVFTENFFDYAIAGCYQYDLMYEQILPSNVMGTDFLMTPYMYHKKGYDYTVTAMDSNTILKKDGKSIDTLDVGDTYYGRIYSDSSCLITADKPVSCWEKNILDTCVGGGGWGGWFSGPSIMTLSSNEQMITDATVSVPASNNFTDNYINIITTKFGKDSTWLDGNLLPSNEFKPIINGSFYLYRDTILKGNHRLMGNYGFISYIYGRGTYGGYAYNASAGLQSLKRLISSEVFKSCDTGRVVKLTSTGDPAKNYQWTFGNQKDTGLTAWFQITKEGTYPVKLKYQLLRNNLWDSVITFLQIKGSETLDFVKGATHNVCKTEYTTTLPKTKLFRYKWSNGDTSHFFKTAVSGKYSLVVTNTATSCKFYDTMEVTLFDKLSTDFSITMAKRCPGFPIYMFNNSVVGKNDSIVDYQWYVDNQRNQKTRHDTVKYAYPGTYDLRLVITSKSGCKDSVEKQIKVQDNPILVTGLRTYDSCYQRASFRFNSQSALSVGRIVRYQWLFSDGDTTYKKMQAIKGFKDSGIYWARFAAFSDAGCSDTTDPLYFKVHGAPAPYFDVTDSSVCSSGNYFRVDNQTRTYGRKVKYEWQWGDGSGETFEEPGFKNYGDTGTYTIALVTAYQNTGCSDTFRRTVQVLPNPKALLTIDSSNFCLNRNYYHVNSNLSDAKGAKVRYTTWKWGDGTQTDSAVARKQYKATGTFKMKMYFSTGKGCLDSAQKNLVVFASPIAKFGISDSSICGSTNYFNLTNGSTAPVNARWNWNYGDGNTSTTKTPGKVSYTGYGDFTITLAVRDPLYNCTDTTRRTVRVLKGLALQPISTDSAICDVKGTFTFKDTTSYGNISPQRRWIFGPNSKDTSTASSFTHQFKTPGYKKITMIGGIPGTCADTVSFNVHVRYPDSILSIQHKINYACIPGSTDLSATINAGSGWNYYWDLGSGQIENTPTVSAAQFPNAGQQRVQLQITDAFGCMYTAQDTFRLYAAPNISISTSSQDTQCIKGNGFAYQFSATDTTKPVIYTWDLGDGSTSTKALPAFHKYASVGSKTVQLSIKDGHACLDTATLSVFVNESPIITITGDTACEGETLRLSSRVLPVSVAVNSITWYDANNAVAGSGANLTLSNLTPGVRQYYAIAQAAGGCADTSNIAATEILTAPTALFNAEIQKATSAGVRVFFKDSSIGGASSWKWYPEYPDRNTSSGAQNLNYLYSRLGKVSAMLVVQNGQGCKDSTVKEYVLISDELIFVPSSFTPNGDNYNEYFKPDGLSAIASYEMVIYNRWGAKIFETQDASQGWDGNYMGDPAPQGGYAYYINLVFLTGKREVIHGEFTLLR